MLYFYLMQVYTKPNKQSIKIIIFFLLIAITAYLPISSFLFALKNDSFTGYFPPKFFMSESIRSGYLPLWNPFINYGIPQYGDMSSAYWNPLTWLIASTVGYNAYSFTIEEGFYIFISGLGMYYLTGYWGLNKYSRLAAGVIYMCCGYFVGHLQHFNWISGAALLPWCIGIYLKTLDSITLRRLASTGFLFFLFVSAAHPGLIIGMIYFLSTLILAFLSKALFVEKSRENVKIIFKKNLTILLSILIFSIGPLVAYLEILPYISRGEKMSIDLISNPTTVQSWLSVLFPLSTTKNDTFFATSNTIRNSYVGLFCLLFFLYGLFTKKTKWQLLLLLLLFIFLIFSSQFFKSITYQLPLIGFVRLSGEYRIFALLSVIIFSVMTFEQNLKAIQLKRHHAAIYFLLSIVVLTIFYSGYQILHTKDSILFAGIASGDQARENLKDLVTSISFYDCLLFQGFLQIFFLFLFKRVISKPGKPLLLLIAIEICIASLLNIPYTGVGKSSLRDIDNILSKSPEGFPIPRLQPTAANPVLNTEQTKMVGDWSFYSKQIGSTQWVSYPITLNNTFLLFQQHNLHEINEKPFAYLDKNPENSLEVTGFSPNHISLEAKVQSGASITIKQNHYPFWQATVNHQPTPIYISESTFMSIDSGAGKQNINFDFKNKKIVILLVFSLILSVTALLMLAIEALKKLFVKPGVSV